MMNLLIVDDSQLLQDRLKKILMKVDLHMRIRQAYSCEEAMEMVSSYQVDTVILDIELHDGSGIELLRKFKEDHPGMLVNIFTNYPTDEFKTKCHELGADYFLDKSDLSGLINVVISQNATLLRFERHSAFGSSELSTIGHRAEGHKPDDGTAIKSES